MLQRVSADGLEQHGATVAGPEVQTARADGTEQSTAGFSEQSGDADIAGQQPSAAAASEDSAAGGSLSGRDAHNRRSRYGRTRRRGVSGQHGGNSQPSDFETAVLIVGKSTLVDVMWQARRAQALRRTQLHFVSGPLSALRPGRNRVQLTPLRVSRAHSTPWRA